MFDESFDQFRYYNDGGAFDNMDCWFANFTQLKQIEGLENVHFASQYVSLNGTFSGCSSLEKLDLTAMDEFYLSTATQMFENCHSLTEVDMSNVIDLGYGQLKLNDGPCKNMFRNCFNLKTIYVSETLQRYDIKKKAEPLPSVKSALNEFVDQASEALATLFAGDTATSNADIPSLFTYNTVDKSYNDVFKITGESGETLYPASADYYTESFIDEYTKYGIYTAALGNPDDGYNSYGANWNVSISGNTIIPELHNGVKYSDDNGNMGFYGSYGQNTGGLLSPLSYNGLGIFAYSGTAFFYDTSSML